MNIFYFFSSYSTLPAFVLQEPELQYRRKIPDSQNLHKSCELIFVHMKQKRPKTFDFKCTNLSQVFLNGDHHVNFLFSQMLDMQCDVCRKSGLVKSSQEEPNVQNKSCL